MPKVSIILPVYNVQKYIANCLDSIVSQTFSDFEVIAVNDSSEDRSIDIVKDYALHDSRFKIIEKEHSGLGLSRNAGIENARGEFIMFVDSDDFLALNAVKTLVSKAEAHSSDLVFFNITSINNYNKTTVTAPLPYRFDIEDSVANSAMLEELLGRGATGKFKAVPVLGSVCRRFVKRSLIEENNIKFLSEEEIFLEDNLFSLELHSKASNPLFISNALYNYRSNNSSLSASFRQNKFEKLTNYYEHVKSFTESNGITGCEARIDGWFVRFAAHESAVNCFSPANKIPVSQKYKQIKQIVAKARKKSKSAKKHHKPGTKKDKFIVWIITSCPAVLTFLFYRLYTLNFIFGKRHGA